MIQFQLYFLSILFNAVAGYLLISSGGRENESIEDGMKFSPRSGAFRLVLGILTAGTGVLKLLSPTVGLPILGDLIPALAGMAAGFMLLFGYYREHSSIAASAESGLDRMGETMLRYKKAAGILLIAVAALHFLFPQALFL
jgi:hypothetical protein